MSEAIKMMQGQIKEHNTTGTQFIGDPIKAEVMAYAEDPERTIALGFGMASVALAKHMGEGSDQPFHSANVDISLRPLNDATKLGRYPSEQRGLTQSETVAKNVLSERYGMHRTRGSKYNDNEIDYAEKIALPYLVVKTQEHLRKAKKAGLKASKRYDRSQNTIKQIQRIQNV